MSILAKVIQVQSGNRLTSYEVYRCDGCGCTIEELWPHTKHGEEHYCPDCAYRLGLAGDNEHFYGYWRAIVNADTGEMEITPRNPSLLTM